MSPRTCIVVAAEGVAVDDSDVEDVAVGVTEDENVEPVVDTEAAVEVDDCGDGEEPEVDVVT